MLTLTQMITLTGSGLGWYSDIGFGLCLDWIRAGVGFGFEFGLGLDLEIGWGWACFSLIYPNQSPINQ